MKAEYTNLSRETWGWDKRPNDHCLNSTVSWTLLHIVIVCGCLQRIANSLESVDATLNPAKKSRAHHEAECVAINETIADMLRDRVVALGLGRRSKIFSLVSRAAKRPRGMVTQREFDEFRQRLMAITLPDLVPHIRSRRGTKTRAAWAKVFAKHGINIDA